MKPSTPAFEAEHETVKFPETVFSISTPGYVGTSVVEMRCVADCFQGGADELTHLIVVEWQAANKPNQIVDKNVQGCRLEV